MSKVCEISGKKVMFGNNVSHALNRTRRRFDANIIKKRFFLPEENRWVTLNVSTSILKAIKNTPGWFRQSYLMVFDEVGNEPVDLNHLLNQTPILLTPVSYTHLTLPTNREV